MLKEGLVTVFVVIVVVVVCSFLCFDLLNTTSGEKKILGEKKNYIYVLDWEFGFHF